MTRPLVVSGLGVLALVLLFGAGLAAYHAGIEWKWWPGPQDCSGPLNPLGSRGLMTSNPTNFASSGWRDCRAINYVSRLDTFSSL